MEGSYQLSLYNVFSYIRQLNIQWNGKGDEPYTVSEVDSRLIKVANGIMYLKSKIKSLEANHQ